jgi:transposase-like protein
MTCDLTDKIFTNEDAARAHFEKLRWPDGPICPFCGIVNEATELKGKSTRAGLYKCRPCQKPFTATMGTLYERSHIPLSKWLLAAHLMASSKKGMSAHQLWRMLGFGSYRTAWFMAHRIREGMAPTKKDGPLGGRGKMARKPISISASATQKNRRHGPSRSFTRWSLISPTSAGH